MLVRQTLKHCAWRPLKRFLGSYENVLWIQQIVFMKSEHKLLKENVLKFVYQTPEEKESPKTFSVSVTITIETRKF